MEDTSTLFYITTNPAILDRDWLASEVIKSI